MTNIRRISNLLALVLAVGGGLAAPTKAQNFYETLFGFARSPEFDAQATLRARYYADARRARAREARRLQEARRLDALRAARLASLRLKESEGIAALMPKTAKTPAPCCMTASEAISLLVKDDTLRPGDAYASTEGLRVFVGSADTPHSPEDFVPLAQARNISEKLRARLAAVSPLDARRVASIHRASVALATPTLLVHAAAPSPSVRSVTDRRGKAIRFVGGAAPQP